MRVRGATAIAFTTALCCAALATAGGGGGDFGGFETRSNSVTKTVNAQTKVARVVCPNQTDPVSAGFRTTHDGLGPVMARLLATRSGSKAAASLFYPAGPPPQPYSLTGYAHCAKRVPHISKRSDSEVIPPTEVESVRARCPQGSRAIAGGFKTKYHPDPEDFTGNVVFGSHPAGKRTWQVRARGVNADSGDGTRLTAIAYCADVAGITTEKKTVPGDEGPSASAVARCPQGRIAISGGFRSSVGSGPIPFEGADTLLTPSESRRVGSRRWKAIGIETFPGPPPTWKAYALCAQT